MDKQHRGAFPLLTAPVPLLLKCCDVGLRLVLLWGGSGADFLISSYKHPLISGSDPNLALSLKSSQSTEVTDAGRGNDNQNHQGCNHEDQ